MATPLLIAAAPRLAALFGREGAREAAPGEAPRAEGHAVLVGFGLAGRTLARVLRARDLPYRAVDANPEVVREARSRGEPIAFGDATRRTILERARVGDARLAIVAVSDPLATREIVRQARRLAPAARIVARTRYVSEVDALRELGADQVIAEEVESGLALVGESLRAFGTAESAVARFVAELRDEGYEPLRGPLELALDPWLTEALEEVCTEWIEVPGSVPPGTTIGALAVRTRTGASVLAVDRAGATLPNPAPGTALAPGDRVLAFGAPDAIARLRALLGAT
jgi:CPA2 family monovalent cation:H+ antiporter-2